MGSRAPQRDLVHVAGQVILLVLVHWQSAGGVVVLVVHPDHCPDRQGELQNLQMIFALAWYCKRVSRVPKIL